MQQTFQNISQIQKPTATSQFFPLQIKINPKKKLIGQDHIKITKLLNMTNSPKPILSQRPKPTVSQRAFSTKLIPKAIDDEFVSGKPLNQSYLLNQILQRPQQPASQSMMQRTSMQPFRKLEHLDQPKKLFQQRHLSQSQKKMLPSLEGANVRGIVIKNITEKEVHLMPSGGHEIEVLQIQEESQPEVYSNDRYNRISH